MDLLALFAITVIGVACFLLLLGGFWIAPWLMVVILVGLFLVLLKIPLFSQDEPLATEDEDFDRQDSQPAVPLVKLQKTARPLSNVGVMAVNPVAMTAPVNDVLQTVEADQKALSYRGAKYKHQSEAEAGMGNLVTINLIECEGRYRGNRSKLFAVKEKLD